jgi:anti-sigma B factor antagonist
MVGEQPVVAVDGAVDLATVPRLRDELLRAVHRWRGRLLVVDLDGVTVLDDTGLGILLGAAAAARRAGGDLELVCSTVGLLERFALTGLDRAIVVRARLTR